MRIGIDVRYLSHGLVGGVHTYVQHIVPALVDVARDHQIFLYADSKAPFELTDLPGRVTVRTLPYKNGLSSFHLDLRGLKQAMAQDRLDIAHFPANYGFAPSGTKSIITLHDEINILPWWEIIKGHPKNARTVAMMTYLHYCSTRAVRQADWLLTVSEYARQQIARYSRQPLERITAIHHAPTHDLRRVSDAAAYQDVQQRHGLTRPYILADGLKNPGVIIRAWRRLPEALRQQYQIVFFSRRPDPWPVIHEAVNEGYARLLIRPSREELIVLFSNAQAFVFPSWIEGFGLPILEAMTCGAPFIGSDRGSIPEVAGNAGLIVDAEDDGVLAQHLTTILTNPAEQERLRQLGYARSAQFSWRKTAEGILACYERVVNSKQ